MHLLLAKPTRLFFFKETIARDDGKMCRALCDFIHRTCCCAAAVLGYFQFYLYFLKIPHVLEWYFGIFPRKREFSLAKMRRGYPLDHFFLFILSSTNLISAAEPLFPFLMQRRRKGLKSYAARLLVNGAVLSRASLLMILSLFPHLFLFSIYQGTIGYPKQKTQKYK